MKTHHDFARVTLLLSVISVIVLGADYAQAGELSVVQQQIILSEASSLYEKGEASSVDRALSKEAYAEAAIKYKTLLDDGVNGWQLYFNLGNAYLQSGRLGPAITSYQRAAELTNNRTVHANLKHAKSLVQTETPQATPKTLLEGISNEIAAIPLPLLSLVAVLFWTCFWIAISFSHPDWRRSTRTAGFFAASLFLAAVVSLNICSANSQQPTGIVTTDQGFLREGNGIAFHSLDGAMLAEGLEVQVLEQRGDWLHVQLQDGRTGWISDSQVDVI